MSCLHEPPTLRQQGEGLWDLIQEATRQLVWERHQRIESACAEMIARMIRGGGEHGVRVYEWPGHEKIEVTPEVPFGHIYYIQGPPS